MSTALKLTIESKKKRRKGHPEKSSTFSQTEAASGGSGRYTYYLTLT
jgi:hypothetical protein